eukprot:TRINITY_DN42714_c0_g1_i1.p1 TRINITY_DN42714_c0_g1~~TRINITY_DN42714_c0_g1_i1.p1  ORF type:complete len:311 (+),score=83.95 TRINITY_DN42714_c0_g1_i1:74-934(+)
MGCGSSNAGQDSKGNAVVKHDIVEPFPAQWAAKKDEADQATSPAAASKDSSSPHGVGSAAAGSSSGGVNSGGTSAAAGASKGRIAAQEILLQDADAESDVEVIFEGKMSSQQNQGQNPQDANAQEAPTSAEPDVGPGSPKDFLVDEQKPIVLSKQQQEEAARMAEQRKRFDNQRYQSQVAAGSNGDQGYYSPEGSAVSRLQLDPKEGIVPSFAAHDAVMGVNASASPRKVARGMEAECLPGGIMDDTPRAEVGLPESRNNHQLFDDDEEMLMKDIVDEVEGSGQRW